MKAPALSTAVLLTSLSLFMLPGLAAQTASPEPSLSPTPLGTVPPGTDIAFFKSTWVAIEGPHLNETEYITSMAFLESGQEDLQGRALDNLSQLLTQGSTNGNDPNIIQIISRICLEPFNEVHANRTDGRYQSPAIRIQALKLLRLAGGEAAVSTLFDILRLEQEPLVLEEAYRTWRFFLPQRSHELIPIMVSHLRDRFSSRPDTILMLEIMQTIRAAHKTYHSMASTGLFQSLINLGNDGEQNRLVKKEAVKLQRYLLNLPENQ